MKMRLAMFFFLILLIPAGMTWAESPVLVSHTLTGYSMGTDSVVLNYTLRVKNSGDSSIHNLTLSLVPLFIVSAEDIIQKIDTLEPQAEIQLAFSLTTPMLLEQSVFAEQPLFWAGEYIDNNGNIKEFPASSVEGGVL